MCACVKHHRELGNIARGFNIWWPNGRAEQQRRNLTADIAHELRTPLHIIQGNLEGMLDGVYEPTPENITDTLDETRLLARLVDDLKPSLWRKPATSASSFSFPAHRLIGRCRRRV